MLHRGRFARSLAARGAAFTLAAMLFAATAAAEPVILVGQHNPNQTNEFTVEFPPELGGPQTADIPLTKFVLEVDPEAGTARLLSWYQKVDELLLAGIPTGDITVALADVSSGVTDLPAAAPQEQGEFETVEAFNVFFEGDLSDFGLESPFFTPSSSTGTILFRSATQGQVFMEWSGPGEIPNPSEPSEPFLFNYVCTINATFVVASPCTSVSAMQAQCTPDELRVRVEMIDDSQDGGVVAVAVGDESFALDINGDQATLRIRQFGELPVISLVTEDDDCLPEIELDCGE